MKSISIALFAVCLAGCVDNRIVSEGDRVGTITKLSHKQMQCFTDGTRWNWEGELAMQGGTLAAGQGVTRNDNGLPNGQAIVSSFAFSLDPNENPDNNVKALRDAMNTGHVVRISYRQVGNHDDCKLGTDYIVTAVIPLN